MKYILKYLGVMGEGTCDSIVNDSGKIKEREKRREGEWEKSITGKVLRILVF